MSLNLMLHCGSRNVEADAVRLSHTPDRTETHVPVPHGLLYDQIQSRLMREGFRVVQEGHGLSANENQWFGMFHVERQTDAVDRWIEASHRGVDGHYPTPGEAAGQYADQLTRPGDDDDYGVIVAARNSHDKLFSASIGCGSQVFICDNLAFFADVRLARRHTSEIMRDLPDMVEDVIGKVSLFTREQDTRISAYKAHRLSESKAALLICKAMDGGVLPSRYAQQAWGEFLRPRHDVFRRHGQTAWRFFNAVTEVLKPRTKGRTRVAEVPSRKIETRTMDLHRLLDDVVGLAA